jgi:hypothetical protein
VKEQDYYRSREMLLADLLRMCRNCKAYNTPETEYFAYVGVPCLVCARWRAITKEGVESVSIDSSSPSSLTPLPKPHDSAGQELETYIRNHFKKNEPAAPGSAGAAAASSAGAGFGGTKGV